MVNFHLLFDLNYFHYISINLSNIYFRLYVYFTASLFLLLVGVSLTLSYEKAQKILTKNQLKMKFLLRGLFIFSLGLLITLVTWLYLPNGFIIFGVLHCIGISIILAYPLIHYKIQHLILGILIIILGIIIYNYTFELPWLLWLGFTPSNFYTVDYFPILPWFGVVLIGIWLGKTIYPNGSRKFKLNDKTNNLIIRILNFLGRHSLIIYLMHQVILIGIFTLLSFL